ncbi:MAG: hypothetical protein Q9169_008488 [Polycauliona sp. 2 TL-2023]
MDVPEIPPSVYDQTGRLLSKEHSQQSSELMWGIIEEAFKYSNERGDEIPQHQSLLDFFKIRLKEKNVDEGIAERVLEYCRSWGDYVGGSIGRQSLKYLWLEETLDGGNLFLASTYKGILSRLTSDVLPHITLHLSTKVTSITSPSSQPSSPTPEPITITTSQHSSLQFDEIVMTAPLGYLKHNTSTFQPPLPPRLLTAIKNIGYGALEKVYLTFPTAFWLSSSADGQEDEGGKEKERERPFFTQWLAPSYTPHHYPVECAFLSSLPIPHAHPTLLFYMHGPLATHITSSTSSLPATSPSYLTTLSEFFKPYYALLPNYTPMYKPTHALATNWQNDEFAGWGSYSNFQISDPREVGEVRINEDIEALREGMPERRVWFAGEHTAPVVALGTVTGAWWSGEGVGRRILGVYGMKGDDVLGEGRHGGEKDDGMVGGREMEEGKVAIKRGGTGLGV